MTQHYFDLVDDTVTAKFAVGPEPGAAPVVPAPSWVLVPAETYLSTPVGSRLVGGVYQPPVAGARPERIEERLTRIEARGRSREKRIDALEAQGVLLAGRVTTLENRANTLAAKLTALTTRVEALEAKVP